MPEGVSPGPEQYEPIEEELSSGDEVLYQRLYGTDPAKVDGLEVSDEVRESVAEAVGFYEGDDQGFASMVTDLRHDQPAIDDVTARLLVGTLLKVLERKGATSLPSRQEFTYQLRSARYFVAANIQEHRALARQQGLPKGSSAILQHWSHKFQAIIDMPEEIATTLLEFALEEYEGAHA